MTEHPAEKGQRVELAAIYDAALRGEQAGMSLVDIVRTLWWGKWIIMLMTMLVVGLAALFVILQTPRYTATIVVAPVTESGQGGLSNAINAFSGLAGLRLGEPAGATEFDKFQATITSVAFAKYMQKTYGLLPVVFADAWDAETQAWVPPPAGGRVARLTSSVKGQLHIPGWQEPDNRSLAAFFREMIDVEPLEVLPLWSLKFEHADPDFAGYLLDLVYKEADSYLRAQRIRQITAQIDYLWNRLSQLTVLEHRQALVSILSQRERELMMLQGDLPFASEVIDPVSVSRVPTWPLTWLILIGSLVLGVLLGILAALLIHAYRSESARRRASS